MGYYDVHDPEWTDTAERGGRQPEESDYATEGGDRITDEERREASDHILLSKSGFPPEEFGDLKVPVVDENSSLSLQLLEEGREAVGRMDDLEDDTREQARQTIDRLASEQFEADLGGG